MVFVYSLLEQMGNVCGIPQQYPQNIDSDQQPTTVLPQQEQRRFIGRVGPHLVQIMQNSYRRMRGEVLLTIGEEGKMGHCLPFCEYAQNYKQIAGGLAKTKDRKQFALPLIRPQTTKRCPYQRVLLCLLPPYSDSHARQYIACFSSLVGAAFSECQSEIILPIQTSDQTGLEVPTQMLISLFLSGLETHTAPLRVMLLARETRMMQMCRFELLKRGVELIEGEGGELENQ